MQFLYPIDIIINSTVFMTNIIEINFFRFVVANISGFIPVIIIVDFENALAKITQGKSQGVAQNATSAQRLSRVLKRSHSFAK